MTAGRRPTDIAPMEKPTIDAEAIHGEMVEAAQSGYLVMAAEHEETLELGKLIGRIETAAFFGNISDSVRMSAYESAKKSKAYKNIANPKTGNHFANIEEFCQVHLDRSSRRMEQVISNRNTVGGALFEQSEKLGLRQVDYNAIKALPSEDQELIKRAIDQTDSRDGVLEILQQLAAKHQREKEALNKELTETKSTLNASREVVGKKETTISELQEKLASKKPEPKPTAAFLGDAALRDLDNEALRIAGLIAANLRSYMVAVNAAELGIGDVLRRQTLHSAVGRVLASARQLAEDFDIPVSGIDAADACGEQDATWAATLRDFDAQQAAKGGENEA